MSSDDTDGNEVIPVNPIRTPNTNSWYWSAAFCLFPWAVEKINANLRSSLPSLPPYLRCPKKRISSRSRDCLRARNPGARGTFYICLKKDLPLFLCRTCENRATLYAGFGLSSSDDISIFRHGRSFVSIISRSPNTASCLRPVESAITVLFGGLK